MYPDPRVVEFVSSRFVPVRVHVKDQRDDFRRLGERYSAFWTPTVLVIDDEGEAQHRIEGFLPADDFLPQLMLGAAHAAFRHGEYASAEPQFRAVVERFPNTESAPEALYWAGVSKYRATNDAEALKETTRAFDERFQDSSWAKKASIWR